MRKTVNYSVVDEGRDKGKLFLLTEMPAEQGEAWAMRALLGLMASGTELPEGFESLGMAGLAQMGVKSLAGLSWEVLKPLLEDMFSCIEIVPDPRATHIHRNLIESDVEEIMTRVKLRLEWWKLHMGFLSAVAPSLSGKIKATAVNSPVTRTHPK